MYPFISVDKVNNDTIQYYKAGKVTINQIAITGLQYCKSLKYSGNNKIAIIALCKYALL